MKTTALLFTGPDRVELGEIELPVPGAGDVHVANILTCVSPGTELRCLGGRQEGQDQWPYVPGYAAVGVVVTADPATGLVRGDRVVHLGTRRADGAVLWGGHASEAVCPAGQVFRAPRGIEITELAAWRLAAIAHHGLQLARPRPGETVVVIGLGPIGHCAARLHASAGARTLGIDASGGRVAAARAAGLTAVRAVDDFRGALGELLPPTGADVIVDATGVAGVAATAITLGEPLVWGEGGNSVPRLRYVFQGSYIGDVTFPYLPFFRREPTLLVPRSDQPVDTRAVLALLERGALSLHGVVGDTPPPSAAAEVYARLRERDSTLLTAAFRWRPDPPS